MKKVILFLYFLCLLILPSTLRAVEVKVIGNESLPWNGVKNGKNTGITVDILNTATKYGAPEFKFELGLPWARAQHIIQNANDGSLILIIPLTRTKAREEKYKWVASLIENEMRIISVSNRKKITSIEDAKKAKIGTIRGFAQIPYMENKGIKNFDLSKDGIQNIKKLVAGRVDAIADSILVAAYLWKEEGQNSDDLYYGPTISDTSHIYIAGNKSFPDEIADQIYTAIEKMKKDGKLDEIINSWK